MQQYQNVLQDKFGNVIVGASVAVYVYGTTTPATIYSGNGTGLLPSNKVITSSLGEFAFYAANGRYSLSITATNFVAESYSDFILYDPADIGAVTASSVAFTPFGTVSATNVQNAIQEVVTDLSASSGSSLVGFLQSGTSAQARTVQAKQRDVVSVKDFGAVGNGIADDTVAIQAAITATATTKFAVYFPAGTYRITSTLSWAGEQALIGDGARASIIALDSASSSAAAITVTTSNYPNLRMESISIKHIQYVSLQKSLYFTNALINQSVLRDVEFRNAGYYAVYFDGTTYFQNLSIEDTSWYDCCAMIGTAAVSNAYYGNFLSLVNVNFDGTNKVTFAAKLVCNFTGISSILGNQVLIEGGRLSSESGWTPIYSEMWGVNYKTKIIINSLWIEFTSVIDCVFNLSNCEVTVNGFSPRTNSSNTWAKLVKSNLWLDRVDDVEDDDANISSRFVTDTASFVKVNGNTAYGANAPVNRVISLSPRVVTTESNSTYLINTTQYKRVYSDDKSRDLFRWQGGNLIDASADLHFGPNPQFKHLRRSETDATYGRILVIGTNGAAGIPYIPIFMNVNADMVGIQITFAVYAKKPANNGTYYNVYADGGALGGVAVNLGPWPGSSSAYALGYFSVHVVAAGALRIYTQGDATDVGGVEVSIADFALVVGERMPQLGVLPAMPWIINTYGTAAPTTGSWRRGDRVVNNSPATGSAKAWSCTVAGSPGTWVSEGNL